MQCAAIIDIVIDCQVGWAVPINAFYLYSCVRILFATNITVLWTVSLAKHFCCIDSEVLCLDLGAAQSSIFGSARNFFGSLSRLEPKITAQQQLCTQS